MKKNCLDFDVSPYYGRIRDSVLTAYENDLGSGDVTAGAVLPRMRINAVIKAEERGIFAGLIEARFLMQELGIREIRSRKEGSIVKKGDVVLEMHGDARKILSAERTILNFITRLSGIATLTHKMAGMSAAKLAATRKTCLSFSDKRAVQIGGGATHRLGLFDMILIKDNHIDIVAKELGCSRVEAIGECVRRANAKKGKKMVEIEVKNAPEAIAAAKEKPDIIMLDGAGPANVKKIAKLLSKTSVIIEASGGVGPGNIRPLSSTSVDYISSGYLTHSCRSLNMSLEVLG